MTSTPLPREPQTSLGLEHLSLLEQLDLGHNLISKAVSARALSFNRSLKLLWLEGNPFALDPRYRPTLTCLLPHVRAIDLRGMPPSGDRYTRGSTGGHRREIAGSTGSRTGVSRAWRVDHDGSRSREWDEVSRILHPAGPDEVPHVPHTYLEAWGFPLPNPLLPLRSPSRPRFYRFCTPLHDEGPARRPPRSDSTVRRLRRLHDETPPGMHTLSCVRSKRHNPLVR